MEKMLRFLSSLRLTLFLLLGLAAIAVFGTLHVPENARYSVYYQSLWFRLLLALLALNLTVCTLRTLRARRGEKERLWQRLEAGVGEESVISADASKERIAAGLRKSGYTVSERDGRLLAEKGRAGRWGAIVVHLSCLLIMGGALAAELGFVGTRNIHVGDTSNVYFDWDAEAERPLGFTFRLDEFEPVYYPIDLQITAYRSGTKEEIETWTTSEGESFTLPVNGLRAEVVDFDPFTKELHLAIFRSATRLGDYRVGVGEHQFKQGLDPGVDLYPSAYRDPLLKQTRSHVSILEQGQVVSQGVIRINHPLVHRGVAIYQTAFDRDPYGFWYAGFQFSKDPGEPLVWAGCIALSLGLLLAFTLRHRIVGCAAGTSGWYLIPLRGFRGSAGKEALELLREEISK